MLHNRTIYPVAWLCGVCLRVCESVCVCASAQLCVHLCVCECYTAFSSVGGSALGGSRRVCWTVEAEQNKKTDLLHQVTDSRRNRTQHLHVVLAKCFFFSSVVL